MLEKDKGKKGDDKFLNPNKKLKYLTSISPSNKIKNVMKPKVKKTTSTDIISSSKKKHVETVLAKNIVIPQIFSIPMKSNETFDYFILYKKEFMNNPENQKKITCPNMIIFY